MSKNKGFSLIKAILLIEGQQYIVVEGIEYTFPDSRYVFTVKSGDNVAMVVLDKRGKIASYDFVNVDRGVICELQLN